MAVGKPEWGTKRACLGCGMRFYHLGRNPIICPGCEARFEPDDPTKGRRARPARVAERRVRPKGDGEEDAAAADVVLLTAGNSDDDSVGRDEKKDQNLIEDASELGEDSDDVSEVMEGVEPGEDR